MGKSDLNFIAGNEVRDDSASKGGVFNDVMFFEGAGKAVGEGFLSCRHRDKFFIRDFLSDLRRRFSRRLGLDGSQWIDVAMSVTTGQTFYLGDPFLYLCDDRMQKGLFALGAGRANLFHDGNWTVGSAGRDTFFSGHGYPFLG